VDHVAVSELLGVYALDACEDHEAGLIEVHLAGCNECRAETERLKSVAGWMGVAEATLPSEHLRSRLLQEAHNTRLDDTDP
jgi:hypothetical protein